MRSLTAALLLFLFATSASARDIYAWEKIAYKKENPEELAYFVSVGDACPISKKVVTDIVERVFVRGGIKPVPDNKWTTDPLHLSIALDCGNLQNNPVYVVTSRFGNASGLVPFLYLHGYEHFGIGSKSSIENSLRDSIEAAITDYIKVNFDVGDLERINP